MTLNTEEVPDLLPEVEEAANEPPKEAKGATVAVEEEQDGLSKLANEVDADVTLEDQRCGDNDRYGMHDKHQVDNNIDKKEINTPSSAFTSMDTDSQQGDQNNRYVS